MISLKAIDQYHRDIPLEKYRLLVVDSFQYWPYAYRLSIHRFGSE